MAVDLNTRFNCAHFEGEYPEKSFEDSTGTCNVTVEKTNKPHYCHNILQNSTKTGKLEVVWAGCLPPQNGKADHITRNDCIVHYHGSTSGKHTYFCSCTGNLCNRKYILNETNLTPPPTPVSSTTPITSIPDGLDSRYKIFYYVSPPVIGCIILVAFLIYLFRRHKRRMRSVNRKSLIPSCKPSTPPSTRPVAWIGVVSRGQFGCVWRATYENNDVAVKIIQAQERGSWKTERNMYENYSLVHENILKFYRAEKRLVECNIFQYWIITQYHGQGSLSDYLHYNILDYDGMIKLMISIVEGLVFLHTENLSLSPAKPIIAHRDFKSRNVLVRDDLTCCIGDFGSACAFSGTYESDETKAQVGTKRYMAPEVLQGAIAFQAEAFLNIDVYALALVLWELVSRCKFANVQVDQAYQAPYEKEVGPHPTIDNMRTCVLDNKLRPILKPEWRRIRRVNEICNTIEECWDDEGDARLTAHCVNVRLKQLGDDDDNDNDSHSLASSGFVESSFINEFSLSGEELEEEYSCSSVVKEPLIVKLQGSS